MGRRSYDMGNGDFTGYEFQVPIFVLTHRVPDEAAKGQNDRLRFSFVTDGIERAIAQAKAAAGDRDVTVVGDGVRLFERVDAVPVGLEAIRVSESPGVTHLRFRVTR